MNQNKDLRASWHRGRAEEVVAREAANFISRESGTESLITVTRAESASHGERMRVFVSVFPTEKAKSAMNYLDRQREAFSDYLKEHTRLVPLPRIDFLLENELLGGPGGN